MPEAQGILLSAKEYKESAINIRTHTLERSCTIKVHWWYNHPNKREFTVEIALVLLMEAEIWGMRQREWTEEGEKETDDREEKEECICMHR